MLKNQSSQGLNLQAASLAIERQSLIDLGDGVPDKVKTIEKKFNEEIKRDKDIAERYLFKTHPLIIGTIEDIRGFYEIQKDLKKHLEEDSKEKFATRLRTIIERTDYYNKSTRGLVDKLNSLQKDYSSAAGNITTYATELNSYTKGDKGALEDLKKKLKDVQDEIDSKSVAAVASGILIVGGVAMILLGAVGELFTGGASTLLIVGGVSCVVAGTAGAIASGLSLSKLVDTKRDIMTQKAQLDNGVKAFTDFSTGMESLSAKVEKAAQSAQEVSNAWNVLRKRLENVEHDALQGKLSSGDLREIYTENVATGAESVVQAAQTIENQFNGARDYDKESAQKDLSKKIKSKFDKVS
ncbi:hemolytic enterotoxin HBL [Haloactinospora alba]|uniref:Hemolytic enterotoxin HBL n=1 Tax=Haloactinospora alba TaxID=405555 RepID=A0A543NNC1_9ACTN|nr:hemolytic enterotoxin HBL [Haloactinospora alba]